MEAEMKMVFQQKVQEKEAKLKQSEEELYARHKEMKDALEKQRADLEDKKRKIESGRPLTPEKASVRVSLLSFYPSLICHPLFRLAERKASCVPKPLTEFLMTFICFAYILSELFRYLGRYSSPHIHLDGYFLYCFYYV
jgi:hypothetical protein